jgi:hypothetical protein
VGLVIRDDKLPRQRSLAVFDPYLPVGILLLEGQMVTWPAPNLMQALVMARNYRIRQTFIAPGLDQVHQWSPEVKGMSGIIQSGIYLRGRLEGGVKVLAPVQEGDGLAIVEKLAVGFISPSFLYYV